MPLDAYLRGMFKGSDICQASIPDGLRRKIQERLLRELHSAAAPSASAAFAVGQHWTGRGGSTALPPAPPPRPVATRGPAPRGVSRFRRPAQGDVHIQETLMEGMAREPEMEEPIAQEPGKSYAPGFCHGFTMAALDDLVVQPLQSRYLDPYLRPDPQEAPRANTAYSWGMAAGRSCLTNQGAAALLKRAGMRGGGMGALGCAAGGFAYLAVKELSRWAFDDQTSPAPDAEAEVAPPATIIYDEKCSVCLEELIPGGIVILVHERTGHACVCRGCFQNPSARDALRDCPLCRLEVTGRIQV